MIVTREATETRVGWRGERILAKALPVYTYWDHSYIITSRWPYRTFAPPGKKLESR
jgi:hypothetical protein